MPPPVYIAPLDDMRFCLETYGGISESLAHPTYVSLNRELVDSVLEEAARFASETLSPLNPVGDRVGAVWNNGEVIMPEGFAPTYQQFVQSGWNAAPFDTEIGGQGLPLALCTAVNEIWHGANMAFGLIPMLTQSAIELIAQHADSELKARYLPKLVTGEWTGSMCMTEPQAGSDVGAVSTRAEEDAAAPGSYRLRGTKIFITYGEHDLAANIVHLVLARVQGAPEGSKGLSLFLVPKFMVAEDGALDARNDVQCISIEEKLGIHASPTCVMAFGEKDGAIGYLVGYMHGGIAAMFTMMNQARLAVGLQGVGLMTYALQLAEQYASERVQGRRAIAPKEGAVAIREHPDVARMLGSIRAHGEACRALSLYVARHAETAKTEDADSLSRMMVDLLTPIVKAHMTERAVAACSLALQVHGGMGYIEETGIAQLWRDARIAPIYEGTNGIQALDLMERKLLRMRPALLVLMEEMQADANRLQESVHALLASGQLEALAGLKDSTRILSEWLGDTAFAPDQRERAHSVAMQYLTQFGTVLEMAMLLKALLPERTAGFSPEFYARKEQTARHFAVYHLPEAMACHRVITQRAAIAL